MTSETSDEIERDYDEFPYYSFPYGLSAPEHLAAVAHAFGLSAPESARARVLELGCAAGGNLIPFAVRNPQADVVGIDLSTIQVEDGLRRIERLQLKNIKLLQKDLTTITGAFGQFDYIVCHGVYSWVPEPVQHAILRICRENLSPRGIAYIGYKTYPGWKAHEIVRDAMLLRAAGQQSKKQRLAYARGMIDFLSTHARKDSVLARAIAQDSEIVRTGDASYLVHDYLESFNAPCYFRDFISRAEGHGLAYLADADPAKMFASNYGDAIAKALGDECGANQVLLEQYLDFVGDRSFRRTLLVHQEQKAPITYSLEDSRLRELHFAATLRCVDGNVVPEDTPQQFVSAAGESITLDRLPIKAAAKALGEAWPDTLAFADLCAAAQSATGNAADAQHGQIEPQVLWLLRQMVIRGLARYRVQPRKREAQNPRVDWAVRAYPADLPEGQALHTFNAWHEPVVLDPVGQVILPLLDGTHTRDDLLAKLAEAVQKGELTLNVEDERTTGTSLASRLDHMLMQLCA